MYSVGGPGLTLYQNKSGFGHLDVGHDAAVPLCRWDPAPACRSGDDYARQMIARVVSSDSSHERIRVLLLGLGCASIAAGIANELDSFTLEAIDAVEVSEEVIAIARVQFLPVLDSCGGSKRLSNRLSIIHADALRPHTWAAGASYTHILVDVPQIYLSFAEGHARAPQHFWAGLGHHAASGGSLIINSWHTTHTALRNDLLDAGWGAVRTQKAGLNTLVLSSDWRSLHRPSRWSRWLRLRHHLVVNEAALVTMLVLNLLVVCCCLCRLCTRAR